jgi:hypothetical protein
MMQQPSNAVKSLFDDDEENHVWSGFITRNKSHRLGVDAYLVKGEPSESFVTDYNLNVSARTS